MLSFSSDKLKKQTNSKTAVPLARPVSGHIENTI